MQAIFKFFTCLILLLNTGVNPFTHNHHIICTSSHHNLKHNGNSKIWANTKTCVKCSNFSEMRK